MFPGTVSVSTTCAVYTVMQLMQLIKHSEGWLISSEPHTGKNTEGNFTALALFHINHDYGVELVQHPSYPPDFKPVLPQMTSIICGGFFGQSRKQLLRKLG